MRIAVGKDCYWLNQFHAGRINGPRLEKVAIAMFDRNKNKPAATRVSEPASPQSPSVPVTPDPVTARSDAMIGPSIVIKGTVTGDEDLQVQGRVEGTIDLSAHVVSLLARRAR